MCAADSSSRLHLIRPIATVLHFTPNEVYSTMITHYNYSKDIIPSSILCWIEIIIINNCLLY